MSSANLAKNSEARVMASDASAQVSALPAPPTPSESLPLPPTLQESAPEFVKAPSTFEIYRDAVPKKCPSNVSCVSQIALAFTVPNSMMNADILIIELSESAKMKNARKMELPFQKENLSWIFPETRAGLYFVRARLRENGQESSPSQIFRLHVIEPPPRAFENIEQEWLDHEAQVEFSFGESSPDSQDLEVQWSDNKAFIAAKSFYATADQVRMSLSSSGHYFVRSRKTNLTHWPTSRWSPVFEFDTGSDPEVVLKPIAQELPDLKPAEFVQLEKPRHPSFWFWGGAGLDYLKFDQQDSSGKENANFANVVIPTGTGVFGFSYSDKFAVEFGYHDNSGQISAGAQWTMNRDSYHWITNSFEGIYYFDGKSRNQENYLRFGLVTQQTPFFYTDGVSRGTVTDIHSTGALLGYGAKYLGNNDIVYELYVRYQQPLSSYVDGGTWTSTPQLNFDGSLSATKKISKNWRAGVFWFGQYLQNGYSFSSSSGTVQRSGTQVNFNSDLELRVGYEYFYGNFIVYLFGMPFFLFPLQLWLNKNFPVVFARRHRRRRIFKVPMAPSKKWDVALWACLWLTMIFGATHSFVAIEKLSEKQKIVAAAKTVVAQWMKNAQAQDFLRVAEVHYTSEAHQLSQLRLVLKSSEELDEDYREKLTSYFEKISQRDLGYPAQVLVVNEKRSFLRQYLKQN